MTFSNETYYCNAASRIRAGTNLTLSPTAKVIFSAPVIQLLPGTTIEPGAYFHLGRNLTGTFP